MTGRPRRPILLCPPLTPVAGNARLSAASVLSPRWYAFVMARRTWVFDPQGGGQKSSAQLQGQTRQRILQHAAKIVPERASQLRVWFKGPFCYVDAQEPGTTEPMHLCRLRYLGSLSGWSLAFFAYSHGRFEPCVFMSGSFIGTPEEGLEVGAVYLH